MKVVVIGSGFAGLSAAASLAQKGYEVELVEKNDSIGGRARQFKAAGFTFDMGPSWYWMPDVFEQFYQKFNYTTSDFYELVRLNPSYNVIWSNEVMSLPSNMNELEDLFESYEKGSTLKLREFLKDAQFKYEVGMNDFVRKPALSITEFMSFDLMKKSLGIDLFQSISKLIRKRFKHPKLIELLEFPVLFLGATPQNTPALYSLMNYADMSLGTWYPMGGMFEIVKALQQIVEEQGVIISLNTEVKSVETDEKNVTVLHTSKGEITCDILVNAGDYHHFDQNVLNDSQKQYSEKYWNKQTLAPSSLLYYVGLNTQLPIQLTHHNLFFDTDFAEHAATIYTDHKWPKDPLFYACIPSKTDEQVAPADGENLFLLVPVSTEIEATQAIKDKYFNLMADRIKKHFSVDIREHIVYRRDFAHAEFKEDYFSFKGNAYGLANTLSQTAFLKPKMKHKIFNNLYHCGQLTTPGPGVPPSIISGEVVADLIVKEHPTK